ncbi:MAG: ammonia-forming cytochrome c nitrite reductase subunit c552 [Myxococcota bacterium]
MPPSRETPERSRRRFPILGGVLLVVVAAAVASTALRYARLPGPEEGVENRPTEVNLPGYASSGACAACHPEQYDTWHFSYHRRMTQVATPEALATDLDGVKLDLDGVTYRFERRGERFWVVQGAPGRPTLERPIVLASGSHNMQLYWAASGKERKLDMLPFHYLIHDDAWVPRNASFLIPADSKAFGADWNTGCIHCHTTKGQPRVDRGSTDTQAAEFGITCEACHGPGDAHVRANHNPVRRYRKYFTEDEDPDIVNPRRLGKERASEVCGRCHGYGGPGPADRKEFQSSGYSFEPGRQLSYARRITLFEDFPEGQRGRAAGMFWQDGMVRGGGREFGMLLESPCFQRGEMSCLSCHTLHKAADDPRSLEEWANDQLGFGMDGNQACASCHEELVANPEPHSHHAPNSTGSSCYNCHMPYTTYGLLKAIRSHEISSPSVSTSLETGRPNACNQCHLDQTLEWAADHLLSWYGSPKPALGADERTIAASILWLLTGDATQRALQAWSLGWEEAHGASGTDWMAPYLAQLLEDPYPAVRFIARRSLRRLPGFERFEVDFLGTEEERREARELAFESWSQRRASQLPRLHTLIDADGALQADTFARLLEARDDRPVIVAE